MKYQLLILLPVLFLIGCGTETSGISVASNNGNGSAIFLKNNLPMIDGIPNLPVFNAEPFSDESASVLHKTMSPVLLSGDLAEFAVITTDLNNTTKEADFLKTEPTVTLLTENKPFLNHETRAYANVSGADTQ